MGLFDFLKGATPSATHEPESSSPLVGRGIAADIEDSLRAGRVPHAVETRLRESRSGRAPWTATLTPAELMIVRSHGLKPVAAVSATCWMQYGWSWTEGHAQGWDTAWRRLREEARAAGANAVLDVKMRTVPIGVENSMDFTLTGTAVIVEGLPAADQPIVATVPALEFVKLMEADVVPTGLAIGARYDWMTDWRGSARMAWRGNAESTALTAFWESIRRQAHADLRLGASRQGNGALAHVNFSQLFEFEGGENQPRRYLGRHIVVATTVDAKPSTPFHHGITVVVDLRDAGTPLTGTARHHEAYRSNEQQGPV